MASHLVPFGTETPGAGIVTINGRYRLPSDLISQLKHVLAENPQVVIIDLDEVAGSSRVVFEVLDPVASYLAAWPGTITVVCVSDPARTTRLLPPTIIDRVVVGRSWEEGLGRARLLVPRQQRSTTSLPPTPQASDEARRFTSSALQEWRLEDLRWAASQVISEFVTHSILQAETVLDLTLSRVERRVRIAVHDHGANDFRAPPREVTADERPEDPLRHRGQMVVRALTHCWGVFPSRVRGKTIWAVMDAG